MRKSMLRSYLPALLAAAMVLVGTSAGSANEIPMTINGEINCAHPDNAITITCRGANPAPPGDANPPPPAPVPTVTPQLPTEAPPPGVALTYSGDTVLNCALPENAGNTRCLPMTNPDGSINCQQADNAITTTCWERGLAEKQAGPTVTPEVDCTLERFQGYPVCTGIKPEAVIVQEQASQATASTSEPVVDPKQAETKIEVEPESNKNLASPAETQTQVAAATGGDSIDTEELPIAGTISLKSVTSKSTTINLELNLGSLAFRVIATKKGAPTITRDLTIDEDGQRTIKFARNLKGYTIRVLVDGEEIDRIRA